MKLSIEGNIGCGKTSVMSRLFKEHTIPIFLEPVDQWKYWLKMFYDDPTRWGFTFNLNVLMSFDNWRHNTFNALYERSPISNRFVFAELQYDNGNMCKMEIDLFHEIYSKLAWVPEIVIYIKTDPEASMQRIINRGRECECNVSFDYIKAVHKKYELIFSQDSDEKRDTSLHNTKVITIDGNQSADDVYADVCKICQQLGIL
jgi:deoxyadenosine/deoxycytidine kinase